MIKIRLYTLDWAVGYDQSGLKIPAGQQMVRADDCTTLHGECRWAMELIVDRHVGSPHDRDYQRAVSWLNEEKGERRSMAVGTPVTVTLDDGTVRQTVTRSEPWQLGHGAWVVLLEGMTGGYNLDRIQETRS